MKGSSSVTIDPSDPSFIENPYPTYERAMQSGGYVKDGEVHWIFRYDTCKAILRDPRFGHLRQSRDHVDAPDPDRPGLYSQNVADAWMLMANPPNHPRIRSLMVKAFQPRMLEGLRPKIETVAHDLVSGIEAGDRKFDFIKAFAHPFPSYVISHLLGVPREDWDRFAEPRADGGRMLDPTPPTDAEWDGIDEGFASSMEYFADLCAQRRRDPADDLISLLVKAADEEGALSERELHANILLLYGAGHETTRSMLGNGMYQLLQHPEQWTALQTNPGLAKNAVEEFLRFDSSVQLTGRTAFERVKMGDLTFESGEAVLLMVGAANRDPAVFDHPKTFDITRQGEAPVQSFGGGIHHCLGAYLSRIEGDIALRILADRLPKLHLDGEPTRKTTFTLRGLVSLPVAW